MNAVSCATRPSPTLGSGGASPRLNCLPCGARGATRCSASGKPAAAGQRSRCRVTGEPAPLQPADLFVAAVDDVSQGLRQPTVLVLDNVSIHTAHLVKARQAEWAARGLTL